MDRGYQYTVTLDVERNASEIPPDRHCVIEDDGVRFRFVRDCWFLVERGDSLRLSEDIRSLPRRLLDEAGDLLLMDEISQIDEFARGIWSGVGPDDLLSRVTHVMFRVNIDCLVINQPMDHQMTPADEAAIGALERVEAPDEGCEESAGCCCICLEEMTSEAEKRMMPCKHVYHEDCIVAWLKKSHLCPLCRFPLPRATFIVASF
ncbi:hypothetical protein MLD38_034320 [Melastoma candidum]|uniref:Uncharacterized protein n=1 Tax=Melastoma candidum TaxID=119954 RepID=A0ACB9MBW2_9MYRT|nr:hypothetical protein MLD38_034320 [Melastoma candidum]